MSGSTLELVLEATANQWSFGSTPRRVTNDQAQNGPHKISEGHRIKQPVLNRSHRQPIETY
jgi:hypothetical protein